MSNHNAFVVPVTLEKHPNADALSLVKVGGFNVVVRTEEWKDKTKGIYIEPDTLVNTKIPEFLFLDGHERIRVRKFRGVISQGLLIHAPDEANIGDDFWERLDLKHYEPQIDLNMEGSMASPPAGIHIPVYDVENLKKYPDGFIPGETVWVTAKIHGTSCRAVYWNDQFHVGSRSTWKKEDEKNLYWKAIKQHPGIEAFCRKYPGLVVYGEVYGHRVHNLDYGYTNGMVAFAMFDLYSVFDGRYFPLDVAHEMVYDYDVPWVYSFGKKSFNLEYLKEFVEQDDPIAMEMNHTKQVMEGLVIRPVEERFNPEFGRVILKLISNGYYLEED